MEILHHAKWRVTVDNGTEALGQTDPVVTWLFGLVFVCVCVCVWLGHNILVIMLLWRYLWSLLNS